MENENFEFKPGGLPGFEAPAPEAAPQDGQDGPPSAGFNERFVAYVIDALPFVVGTHLSLGAAVRGGLISLTNANEWKWRLLWMFAYVVYETIFSSGGRATLGKFLLGIRVRALDGGELSWGRAFLRSLAYFLSSGTLNLGYLIALFTPKKRALHDFVCGSRVVSVRERGDLASGLVLAVSWGLLAIFIGSWINQSFLKITPFEKKQIVAAHRTITKIAKLEELYMRQEGHYTKDLKRLADLTGNVNAVRAELFKTLEPGTLTIATNGARYQIKAKARNWRKTEVQISSKEQAPLATP